MRPLSAPILDPKGPRIIDAPQGSDEWRIARCGLVTASRFVDVLAGGKGLSRDQYLRQLAGEVISGIPMETFRSKAMDHGTEVEPQARALYEITTETTVDLVGFIVNGRIGASPDGLVDDDGAVEIKRQEPDGLINRMFNGTGNAHDAQCQGTLMVTGRKWIDLAHYFPGFPLVRRRMKRDENYIARLKLGLETFVEDLDALVARIRSYRT